MSFPNRKILAGLTLIVTVLIIAALIFHQPLLRMVANTLIVDEPTEGYGHLVIFDGDHRHAIAGELFRSGKIEHVLMFEGQRKRLVEYGILPPRHEIARRQLEQAGIPADAISLVEGETQSIWQVAKRLDSWLRTHKTVRVTVFSERFSSGDVRQVLDTTLSAESAARVRVRALPDRRYDETNWWRTRRGIKSFGNASMVHVYRWINGRPKFPFKDTWDPDEYQAQLAALRKTEP
jgi:hypothetical protein